MTPLPQPQYRPRSRQPLCYRLSGNGQTQKRQIAWGFVLRRHVFPMETRGCQTGFFNVPSCRLKFISLRKTGGVQLSDDARILAWGNGKEAIVRCRAPT